MPRKLKVNPLIEEVQAEVPSSDSAQARVWERRLLNPFHQGEVGVTIKDAKNWELHWIDAGNPGRFHTATRELGWIPVKPDELEDNMEALGLQDNKDGMVSRGIKGQEKLMKMPVKVFQRIRRRKAEITMNRVKKTRENLANAAVAKFGTEQAADFVLGKGDPSTDGVSGLKGNIIDGIE